MNAYENRAKRIKLLYKTNADQKIEMEKMVVDTEIKSNFSSINPASGAIVRGGNANAKGDVRKLVIKNFKGKSPFSLASL